MRMFRNHGITRNADKFTVHRSPFTDIQRPTDNDFQRSTVNGQRSTVNGQWYYEMQHLGYNYRITDFQCALGLSQLKKLPEFLQRRREIAAQYDKALEDIPGIEPFGLRSDVLPAAQSANRPAPIALRPTSCAMRSSHSYHLYVVRVDVGALGIDRATFFTNLREKGIGVNVHYIPVHLHPFYRKKFHTGLGLFPVAEDGYKRMISLPIFPMLTDNDVSDVIMAVTKVISKL